jgi:hypothetical protein
MLKRGPGKPVAVKQQDPRIGKPPATPEDTNLLSKPPIKLCDTCAHRTFSAEHTRVQAFDVMTEQSIPGAFEQINLLVMRCKLDQPLGGGARLTCREMLLNGCKDGRLHEVGVSTPTVPPRKRRQT